MATHNLALMVINDGNGEQCGYEYRARLQLFKHGSQERILRGVVSMVMNANAWLKNHFDADSIQHYDALELLQAIKEVIQYYNNHVEEL